MQMGLFSRNAVEVDKSPEHELEQSVVMTRLQKVETKVKDLETEVHELQLAKARLHPEDK